MKPLPKTLSVSQEIKLYWKIVMILKEGIYVHPKTIINKIGAAPSHIYAVLSQPDFHVMPDGTYGLAGEVRQLVNEQNKVE